MAKVDFAILGAGAIGSILGAHLARAGQTVAMLARGRRAVALRETGLQISGLVQFTVPVQVIEDHSELRDAGVLIVATKAIDTAQSLKPLAGARIGKAFSIQNGMMKNELLAEAFGREHVLGALANVSGELLPTGEVLFTRNVNVSVGHLDGGMPEFVETLARTIDDAGVRTTAVPDILSREWSKFAGWVGLVGVALTVRTNTWQYLMDPDGARALVQWVREVRDLAQANGVAFTDNAMFPVATLSERDEDAATRMVTDIGRQFRDNAPRHRVSTLQDVEAGRPLEVEETLGYASRLGTRLGVPLPRLEMLYRLAAAIDRTSRPR
jgi:2-dehydropantoate 2-reductase